MLDSWFDERFWAAAADGVRRRIRLAATFGAGLLLATAADWRAALAWTAAALTLEALFGRLARPAAVRRRLGLAQACGLFACQLLLTCAWSVAGVILWRADGALAPAAAMSFFAVLLLYVARRHAGSPALAAAALPALAAPVLTPLLAPSGAPLDHAAILVLASLASGQAAWALARSLGRTADAELSLLGLAEAKAEAEAASHAKSAFLATMSHEIRTPLNSVLGMTQALTADPTLTPAQRQRLAMIRESGEALLAILNDILDLSKVEAGKLELEDIEFDLAEVARGAHESFTALAAQKGLSFKLAVDPASAGVYRGDPTRLRQILYNLISNALKFTEQGEIRVAIDQAGKRLRLTVADTGVGIDAAQRARLFQKFEQADASSTRRYGGSGLGLAICRDLAGLMGGSIEVESEPSRGARFIVTLPLPKVAEAPAATAHARAATPPQPDASSLRVLAAEDNATNQTVLKALLAPIGVEPTMVDNGARAVQAWASSEFDLILMDIQMPGMDGVGAARAIRAEEARTGRARTPIVALTANAMSHQVEEYFAAGMDGHLAKPIEMRALHKTIETVQARLEEAPAPATGGARAAWGR